ncbi:MAG: hypothetical protein MSC31_17735 [Solirubrobacteraceae bacterium MAG38_C4-C5]|nr:hypothetical protein [Candidatus Siliceabacter maunaloa]
MPVSHAGPRLEAPALEDATGALRARGLGVSAARRLVLEAIYAADGPISALLARGYIGTMPHDEPLRLARADVVRLNEHGHDWVVAVPCAGG